MYNLFINQNEIKPEHINNNNLMVQVKLNEI